MEDEWIRIMQILSAGTLYYYHVPDWKFTFPASLKYANDRIAVSCMSMCGRKKHNKITDRKCWMMSGDYEKRGRKEGGL